MKFEKEISSFLELEYGKTPQDATPTQLYNAVSKAAMRFLAPSWHKQPGKKRACYFSAEFLVGRLVYSNLMNLRLLEKCEDYLKQHGIDPAVFEQIEDDALGNGGLGRLAACFLDSAATHNLPLDGYGIRYRYGLFKQYFKDGFQKETADDWLRFGDPWSVCRPQEKVMVEFGDQKVWAVPYDMPVIGFGGKTINTLRLWEAQGVNEFDFDLFNKQQYELAVKERDEAEWISAVLYPNDDTPQGKRLRLKQQYFFSSASLQSILREYVARHGEDFSFFSQEYAIQLNDTHPTVSIPELLRILMGEYHLPFDQAFTIVKDTFAYTNHTIMAEALEKWDVNLFVSVLPSVYPYVVMIDDSLKRELRSCGILGGDQEKYKIVCTNMVHMARMAIYATHSTNGVARIHTEILKDRVLHEWFSLYPDRFNNKTNGITQRRWLALCNRPLADFITQKIGDGWITDLDQLERLRPLADDSTVLAQFMEIKAEKKKELCAYIKEQEGVQLCADFIFDVQIKRLHEYKRQLLNAFCILDIYFGLKDGRVKDFYPTVFLFGAKAAPGYYRAKGIIKFINEIARLINGDPKMKGKMQVLFVQNYNVSYAQKLIPAADISEQISTAGTEASGTSNMKFMLNGAVTLGTLDGANIEIVERAGEENNYIFGATVQEIEEARDSYHPKKLYEENPRIKRVVDTLIDGTFSDGKTGMFKELYDSLLEGADWHKADQYYLLLDFIPYCEQRLKVNRDYADRLSFTRKCFLNTANAGKFSSDRTIMEYANEIWDIG
ncbi:glycogen/starch/alpha-glucan phosphorylase [Youxingia wuxianensis]|uniref:Alpha-1,4 glucan phosphorylase n=1 Tax=Youxingia wuxianensis TaxID=2763678 RepID=A0A926IHP7_9FIRM|nr:glycogen/starch/alpha-glucan phosphorylase [Youxingia wuxianensis]MBC8585345.1 glycogen/starch/alpha-glucan phosphorylase [Youxingia wuxianensis]